MIRIAGGLSPCCRCTIQEQKRLILKTKRTFCPIFQVIAPSCLSHSCYRFLRRPHTYRYIFLLFLIDDTKSFVRTPQFAFQLFPKWSTVLYRGFRARLLNCLLSVPYQIILFRRTRLPVLEAGPIFRADQKENFHIRGPKPRRRK